MSDLHLVLEMLASSDISIYQDIPYTSETTSETQQVMEIEFAIGKRSKSIVENRPSFFLAPTRGMVFYGYNSGYRGITAEDAYHVDSFSQSSNGAAIVTIRKGNDVADYELFNQWDMSLNLESSLRVDIRVPPFSPLTRENVMYTRKL